METAHVEAAAGRYFGRMLGFPPEESGSRFSEAVTRGCPPFLLGCAAVELQTKLGISRAVAPGRSEEWLTEPLAVLGGICAEYIVFLPGHILADSADAVEIPLDADVYGAIRVPNRKCAFGVRKHGRFVSWASAADMGGIYNITVETAPAHRQKGYARHALAALTSSLLERDQAMVYLCEAARGASARTAAASGFYEYARLRRVIAGQGGKS